MSIGKQLHHWRREKGWTIGQLAMRSGVSKASLSRWEAEQVRPRVRELESVLDALNLAEVLRVQTFSQLGSVRSVERIISASGGETIPEKSGNFPWGELPRAGALLRALRVRAGYTQWEVATLLGLQQSSVGRWETSTEAPTTEHLRAVCSVLNATAEEKEILGSGPFILPSTDGVMDLSDAERRQNELLKRAVFGTWDDADLSFFQLEADLWPAAQKDTAGLELLMEVYSAHARFLVWRQRYSEAKRYLNLLRRYPVSHKTSRNGLSVPAQTGLLLEAEPAIQSGNRSLPTTLQRLIQQQELITHLEHQAWLYMTAAEGYAVLGRAEEAAYFCAKGVSIPMSDGRNRSGDPATLLFRATMYNHIGRPESALLDADVLAEQYLTPAQHTKVAVVRAGAYSALGDTWAASDAIQTGYRMIERYRTTGYKSSLDMIAEML